MTIEDISEAVNKHGVSVIESMQNILPNSAIPILGQVRAVSDPTHLLTIYFPLLTAVHSRYGIMLLLASLAADWFNMIFKWLAIGDRPYWWVWETNVYSKEAAPQIKQFPTTCSDQPGFPADVATSSAAALYVFCLAASSVLIKRLLRVRKPHQQQRLQVLVWASAAVWLSLVISSRVYVGSHFPHQCIISAVIGLTLAIFISKFHQLMTLSRMQYVAITSIMLVSVLGLHFGLRYFEYNSFWPSIFAVKWCMNRSWLNVDILPFYPLARAVGSAFGLGMALTSTWYKKSNRNKFSNHMVISLAILCGGFGQAATLLSRSLDPRTGGWYVAQGLIFAAFTYLVVAGLPHLVRVASNVSSGSKYKKK